MRLQIRSWTQHRPSSTSTAMTTTTGTIMIMSTTISMGQR